MVTAIAIFDGSNDTTLPAVTITAPSSGAAVRGTVAVTASASDNTGVVGVQFLVDGAPLGAEDTAAPYSVTWDTTSVSGGAHAVTARARDAAGNVTTSAAASAAAVATTTPDLGADSR